MPPNKALQMDPHVSRLVRPVTHTELEFFRSSIYCQLSLRTEHLLYSLELSNIKYPTILSNIIFIEIDSNKKKVQVNSINSGTA